MADLDIPTLRRLALKLGLVTEGHLQECLEEVGDRGGDAGAFLRTLERKGYLTPWQSGKLLKGDADGYFLGGYRVLYRIAAGSFGRVYRADDPHSGVVVAIKVLRRRWSEDPHNIVLFEREGKIGLTLRHPNIVSILAIERERTTKQYYIVMEFVEGGNLRDFLAIRKTIQPAEALRIIEDAAAGMAYAFERSVAHRDIKPSNILISSQGVAKLVDFGLARFNRADLAGETSRVDRTVDYAGLEKATGVKSGDPRSDIYFLGCVLYEMLTGRSPLELSRNPRERMRKSRFDNVKPMRREELAAPPAVFHLVETMMALQPQNRYQSPPQLLEAVRDVRRDVDGGAAPAGGTAAPPAAPATRTVFVVERHEKVLNAIRDKFREVGYRVLLAADPTRALERYRIHPFDALVVDVGTTGEEGLQAFVSIRGEAARLQRACASIVVLSEEQAAWAERIPGDPTVAVLVRPVSLKQLQQKLEELAPLSGG